MSIKFSWRKLTLEKSIVKKIRFKLRELKKKKNQFSKEDMITFQIYHTGLFFFPFLCVFMTQNQFPLKILGTKLTSEKNSPKQWLYSSDLAECRKWLQHLRLVYQSRMVFMVFFVLFLFYIYICSYTDTKNPTKGSSSFKYIEWYQNSLSLDISSSDKYTYVYIIYEI